MWRRSWRRALLKPDICGHEAVPVSHSAASTTAGLDPRVSVHLLVAKLATHPRERERSALVSARSRAVVAMCEMPGA